MKNIFSKLCASKKNGYTDIGSDDCEDIFYDNSFNLGDIKNKRKKKKRWTH